MEAPLKELADDLDAAEQRLAAHRSLEFERMRNGLETDLERYLNNREITD